MKRPMNNKKPLIDMKQINSKYPKAPQVFKNHFIGNRIEQINRLNINKKISSSTKDFFKRDRTLTSKKFFKRKSSRHYIYNKGYESSHGSYNGVRNSAEFTAYKSNSKQSQFNYTKTSTEAQNYTRYVHKHSQVLFNVFIETQVDKRLTLEVILSHR